MNSVPTEPVAITPEIAPPLKICLLGYRSNPFSGGQGIYLKYLSHALLEAGHSVDIISGPPYPDLDPRVKLIELPSLDLFATDDHVTALRPRHLLSFTDFFEWFSMLTGGFAEPYTFGRRLIKYFKKHRPDYDIIHDNQSLCYGTLWLQQQGYPLVTTIHHPITSDREIALKNAQTWGDRLLIKRWHSFINMQIKVVRKLKHIVTVSEVSRQDISAAFGINADKLSVVHNGIATEVFRPIPEIQRMPFRIMATASADQPLKGLKYLIQAIAELRDKYPRIHLLVVGKLNPEGETETLIQQLGISDNLTFVSGISTEAMVEHYARANIVVVPSVYEGFGLPAGEAMACGVPVISTTGGALPEVVGEDGILVPVRDHHAIANAISELLENPARREQLGEAGRQRILSQFSWQVAANQMLALYQQVLSLEKAA